MWNVYEYPFLGIAIAIVAAIIFWIFRAVCPDKKRRWQYLIPILIAAAAVAISYFVQTDKEKILGTVNKGIKAFEQQKIEPIREIIAENYADSHHSAKTYIVAYCQGLFETAAVEKVSFLSSQVEIENDKANFTLEAMVKFAERSQLAQMGKSFLIVKAKLYFERTAGKKWLINGSEILELDRKPIDWGQVPR